MPVGFPQINPRKGTWTTAYLRIEHDNHLIDALPNTSCRYREQGCICCLGRCILLILDLNGEKLVSLRMDTRPAANDAQLAQHVPSCKRFMEVREQQLLQAECRSLGQCLWLGRHQDLRKNFIEFVRRRAEEAQIPHPMIPAVSAGDAFKRFLFLCFRVFGFWFSAFVGCSTAKVPNWF